METSHKFIIATLSIRKVGSSKAKLALYYVISVILVKCRFESAVINY